MSTKTSIEIPRTRAGTLYDFSGLEIGGRPIIVAEAKRGSLESCAWRAGKRLNRKFTVRAFVDQDKQTKIGCWRVATVEELAAMEAEKQPKKKKKTAKKKVQ